MFFGLQLYSITEEMNTTPFIPAWNFIQAQIILTTFHVLPSSCVSDTQQTIMRSH